MRRVNGRYPQVATGGASVVIYQSLAEVSVPFDTNEVSVERHGIFCLYLLLRHRALGEESKD